MVHESEPDLTKIIKRNKNGTIKTTDYNNESLRGEKASGGIQKDGSWVFFFEHFLVWIKEFLWTLWGTFLSKFLSFFVKFLSIFVQIAVTFWEKKLSFFEKCLSIFVNNFVKFWWKFSQSFPMYVSARYKLISYTVVKRHKWRLK